MMLCGGSSSGDADHVQRSSYLTFELRHEHPGPNDFKFFSPILILSIFKRETWTAFSLQ